MTVTNDSAPSSITQAGIAFWSETLGPGVSLENTKDTRFIDRPARDAAS